MSSKTVAWRHLYIFIPLHQLIPQDSSWTYMKAPHTSNDSGPYVTHVPFRTLPGCFLRRLLSGTMHKFLFCVCVFAGGGDEIRLFGKCVSGMATSASAPYE